METFLALEQQAQLAPSLIIGIGRFGITTLNRLAAAKPARPNSEHLRLLWVDASGWHDQPPQSAWEEWDALELDEWRSNWQAGQQLIRDHLLGLQRAVEQPRDLDFYIVADLNDAVSRAVWQDVLALVRSAHIPFLDHIVTLILGIDTLALSGLTKTQADQWYTDLDALESELIAAADPTRPPGRIGWCYLLDRYDTHAFPLAAVADDEEVPLAQLQADHAAEFILQLYSGLRRRPAYSSSSIADAAQEIGRSGDRARVSSFAAGSMLFPAHAIAQQACDLTAMRLLSDHIIGQPAPSDQTTVRRLYGQWERQSQLTPQQIDGKLRHDLLGNALALPIAPLRLEDVSDTALLDTILNWDMTLMGDWQSDDSPQQQVMDNGDRIVDDALEAFSAEITPLLQHEAGGTRIAVRLAAHTQQRLKSLSQQPAYIDQPDHWLPHNLRGAERQLSDPTDIPNQTAAIGRLRRALRQRLIPLAVYTRAAVIGVGLASCILAAYDATAISLGELVSERVPAIQPYLAAMGAIAERGMIAILCLLLALAAGVLHLNMTEGSIVRASTHLVALIQQKYRALLEIAVCEQRSYVYAQVEQGLSDWQQRAALQHELLDEATLRLQAGLAMEQAIAPLSTERSLLPQAQWQRWMPTHERSELAHLAEVFLAERTAETGDSAEFVDDLRHFSAQALTQWRISNLSLRKWVAQSRQHSLTALLTELSNTLRPGLPLGRFERAVRRPSSMSSETRASPLLKQAFTGMAQAEDATADDHYFTGDAGRIAFVPTVHAIDLRQLRIWDVLQSAENDAPDYGTLPLAAD